MRILQRDRSHKRAKGFALLIGIILLLSCVVGGTLAYISTRTPSVVNSFQPSQVSCSVVPSSDGAIKIRNTGDIDAYIRAYYIVNWMDESGNVSGTVPVSGSDYTVSVGSDWTQTQSGGFWYYTTSGSDKVAPNEYTNAFVTGVTVNTDAPAGYQLSVEVVAEAIQASGTTSGGNAAYQNAWSSAPDFD